MNVAATQHSSPTGFIVIVVLAVLLLGYMTINGRKRQRAAAAQQSEIVPGTTIVTRAGLIATLVDRHDDYVVLQLDDGTRARFVPQAVARVWEEPVPVVPDAVGSADHDDQAAPVSLEKEPDPQR